MRKKKGVRDLDWSNQGLTTESLIKKIEGEKFHKSLATLNLEGNKIESLEGVKFPGSLVVLYLRGNNISQEEVDKLPMSLRRYTYI